MAKNELYVVHNSTSNKKKEQNKDLTEIMKDVRVKAAYIEKRYDHGFNPNYVIVSIYKADDLKPHEKAKLCGFKLVGRLNPLPNGWSL